MPKRDIIPIEEIRSRILVLRGHRLLLDADLAAFYRVSTKVLNQAVKRNENRFPHDFCIYITNEEVAFLKSQFVTSRFGHGGRRKLPLAFTEHGALMVATVLNSKRAVQVSLVIIRAFVSLRQMISDQKALSDQLAKLDARLGVHDEQIAEIIEAIRQLAMPSTQADHDRKIGFHAP